MKVTVKSHNEVSKILFSMNAARTNWLLFYPDTLKIIYENYRLLKSPPSAPQFFHMYILAE